MTIDLRSDTITRPSKEMMEAMYNAPLGDDVWGDDPTVNKLQAKTAELCGKEAAIYVPSGTMSNQIAIALHTNSGDEIIFEADAHIFKYEAGSPAVISRVMLKSIPSADGMPDIDLIKKAFRPVDIHFPYTKLICLENTHNFLGGRILSLDYIKEVSLLAKENNIAFHCDGARLWNASAASGISIKEYCSHFDTVSLCFSKGMGAPVGSILVGSNSHIAKARRLRKMLGGAMRQSGLLAAACIYAIDNNFAKLSEDHRKAKAFTELLSSSKDINIDAAKVETNIVFFNLAKTIDTQEFVKHCKDKGILIAAAGERLIRAVFHLDVSMEDSIFAAEQITTICSQLSGE